MANKTSIGSFIAINFIQGREINEVFSSARIATNFPYFPVPLPKLKTRLHGAARTDLFTSPDYFNVDELLSDEQKLVRESVRNYVKKEISPIIEDYAQRAEFPPANRKSNWGELGCFGPTVPVQYGGGGLDYISYGLMMQELERGDSGVRSTASVQGSLVMYPIYAYGKRRATE
jgi:alkylation response protein AidB-like acyl-CoA dehydrogenase